MISMKKHSLCTLTLRPGEFLLASHTQRVLSTTGLYFTSTNRKNTRALTRTATTVGLLALQVPLHVSRNRRPCQRVNKRTRFLPIDQLPVLEDFKDFASLWSCASPLIKKKKISGNTLKINACALKKIPNFPSPFFFTPQVLIKPAQQEHHVWHLHSRSYGSVLA